MYYLLDADKLGNFADRAVRFQNAEVETHRYATFDAASAAAKRYASSVDRSGYVKTLNEHRYTRNDSGNHELVMPLDALLLRIEGRDSEHVDAVRSALPFIAENPDKNLVWVLFTEHLAAFFAGVGVYIVLVLLVTARAMSAAATVRPQATVAPASRADLEKRLLALEALDAPIAVAAEANGRIVVTWKVADEKWRSLITAGGIRRSYIIQIQIDESARRVRATLTARGFSWSTRGFLPALQAFWSREIAGYRREAGVAYGVDYSDDGWRIDTHYAYRFNASEITQPVIKAIVDNGWTWKPVYTLFRPIGG